MIEELENIADGIKQYPLEFISEQKAIVLEETESKVLIGIGFDKEQFEEKNNLFSIAHHGKEIFFKEIPQEEILSWCAKKFSEETNERNLIETKFSETGNDEDNINSIEKISKDAPVINLVNSILMDAIKHNASDIHIESEKEKFKVRFRINGDLRTVQEIEGNRFSGLSSRIKIMANLNILEKRLPQDGKICIKINGQDVDLRVSIVPVTWGESIVLRILGKKSELLELESLGFDEDEIHAISRMIKISHGLILVTGPTGSGKTTTLNAILNELVCDERKIISIEDPVEFSVDGVQQIQINDQIGLTFEKILRRVLRQDPNVIMVGEIRDKITAELCVRAALTGHLILSTLHTNDAAGAVERLVNMGIENFLVASVLKGVIAQRLVKGKNGRIVIAEMFEVDGTVEEKISRSHKSTELKEFLVSKGMETLSQKAMKKIRAGITVAEEVEKEINLTEA